MALAQLVSERRGKIAVGFQEPTFDVDQRTGTGNVIVFNLQPTSCSSVAAPVQAEDVGCWCRFFPWQ